MEDPMFCGMVVNKPICGSDGVDNAGTYIITLEEELARRADATDDDLWENDKDSLMRALMIVEDFLDDEDCLTARALFNNILDGKNLLDLPDDVIDEIIKILKRWRDFCVPG